ncbi:hypothetical protein VTG60DRAFT_5415 [Thermothelomyces hinnuleus]
MLTIHFPYLISGERQYYRLDMKFGIIQGIHRSATESGCSGLSISLKDPPLARKKQTNMSGTAWTDSLVWGEDELWHRAVEIKPDSQSPLTQPISLDEEAEPIDIGRWTTYLLDLEKPAEEQWLIIEAYLHEWNITTNVDVKFAQIPSRDPELWDMLSDPHLGALTNLSWSNDFALLSPPTHIALPFDVRYQLEVCVSRGILSEYNIGREWLENLSSFSGPANWGAASRARLILEYAADQGRPIHDPLELFKDHGAMTYYPATLHIPDYCALIRRAIVTPTRIYFSTPTVETSNRVVRRYQHIQDHFLRVQFTDELLDGRIRACEVDRDDELYARVCRVMTQGIRMGKWHWKFLAFGNSQIRESAAFFFFEPEDGSVTCDSIRQWMGNFDHITSVAKLAARLGQCFSTTRLLHCISSPRIARIPDVESENGFCFTDGIGKISLPLACLVAEDWKLDRPPSAVQFRMGGCKGVLVQWPNVKGTEIHIRPSQEKFCAEYNGLEIIRCSQFSCATLNRQTILVLSCLGVPDEVFIDMMASQIANFDAAMTDKDTAVELLDNYVDENLTTTTIASMLRNGFMHTREPFVRTVLQLWRSWSIKALKEKARLVVEQGAFVLGCVDETGTLKGYSRATEGQSNVSRDQLPQIFLQIPDRDHRHAYKVVTGLCIVGRNPSLHPGDIRVVEAVDVPQLRHLRDNDRLPLIAHAHLATADYELEGAKHWKCLQLAELHSTAVDYVKTGVPAQWNKKLDPRRYPHFMEKPRSRSYHSTSVLGKLYDMVEKEVFDSKDNYTLPFDDRILRRYTLGNSLLKEARKIKGQYDIAMRRIMGQLEIRTEFEVWTTFVMSKPRVGTDYKVQEKVGREAAGLKKQFRDLCLRVVEEHSFDKLEFVAGMYRVTWEETKIALYEARHPHVLPNGTVGLRRVSARSMPLISFPWLFPAELGKIALDAENQLHQQELGVTPSAAKPTPGAGKVVQLQEEFDLADMECTRTSDGQIIHRGEVLHLLRHNDDDDDDDNGHYWINDAVGVDSSTESTSGSASKGEQETRSDFPTLLELDIGLDDANSFTRETACSNAEELAALDIRGANAANLSLLDLLTSDTDAAPNSSPCLTPVKPFDSQQQQTTATTTVTAAAAEAGGGITTTATSTTQVARPAAEAVAAATPTTAVLQSKDGTKEAHSSGNPSAELDSVVSDSALTSNSNGSWDPIANSMPAPASETEGTTDREEEWEPVQYKSFSVRGGLFSMTGTLSSAEVWGGGDSARGPESEPGLD